MTENTPNTANTNLPSSLPSLSVVASRQQDVGYASLVAVASPTSCGSVQSATASMRILRLPEVIARVGLRRASIYQHIAAGSFPKQISLGIRAVGWLESEIDEWLAVRINARLAPKNGDAV